MKVIWFDLTLQAYQFGSYEEFEVKAAGMPNKILGLEKFRDASGRTLKKIVTELNKCRLSRLK